MGIICMVNKTSVEEMAVEEDKIHSKSGKCCHRAHHRTMSIINQTGIEQMGIREEHVHSKRGNY